LGARWFLFKEPVTRWQRRVTPPVEGTAVIEGGVDRALRLASWTSRTTQVGSLAHYMGVTLVRTFLVPMVAQVVWDGSFAWPGGWRWPDGFARPMRWPAAALIVTGASATTLARRRFAAVLLRGSSGYGMALLFVAQGAPDLALTQFGVET